MDALVAIDDFAEFLQMPVQSLDVAAATRNLEGASSLVRDEIGQSLDYVADDVLEIASPGGRLILLPELPVVDVTLVRTRLPGDTDWVELVAGTDYEVQLGRAGKVWRIGGHEWPRSTGRGLAGFVEITYSHGYDLPDDEDPYSETDPAPDVLATVVKRVAARGYANPEAVRQESTGRDTVDYGFAAGLYLSNDDKRDLHRLRPGGAGGSK